VNCFAGVFSGRRSLCAGLHISVSAPNLKFAHQLLQSLADFGIGTLDAHDEQILSFAHVQFNRGHVEINGMLVARPPLRAKFRTLGPMTRGMFRSATPSGEAQ
jgi:hypothetical protein